MGYCDVCKKYLSSGLMQHRASHFGRKGMDLAKANKPEPTGVGPSYTEADSFEEVWDRVNSVAEARMGRIKKDIRKHGGFRDLTKSVSDYDDPLTRAERYLTRLLSRGSLVKGSALHDAATNARDCITEIKGLARLNARTPAPNLVRDIRKAEEHLACNLLEIQAILKGSNLQTVVEKALEKAGG